MKKLLVVNLLLLLCGCSDGPKIEAVNAVAQPQPQPQPQQPRRSPRITVETHGWVAAGEGNRAREILIIKDSKTGVEYLAVTGCGVAEMISNGKVRVEE